MMRGIYSSVTDIRRKVFTEVARLAYEGGDYSRIEELPYKIVPGEKASYRESIFLERAIVGERLRLAMGLPLRPVSEHAPLTKGVEESAIAEKYYDPPLVNIIKFACNSCPEKLIFVTNGCQGCLAHPCKEVCPKGAISMVHGKSFIDQEKCIKCGRCVDACPYSAIIRQVRPCAAACGMDAISSDELGRANIDYDKCVSCGMCIVNCPFGAISDKGQLFQLIHAINAGERVFAAVAPSFVGQLGPKVTPERLKGAMQKIGFADVAEVAVGADLCTIDEAEDFLKKVPAEQPFMATSCCPAWSVMAKKLYPDLAPNISMALTPMVLTARLLKKEHKNCKVAFIGPCSAKKLEASRRSVRSDVDFVLTFEEVMGMFVAKGINFDELTEEHALREGTAAGRGFAVSGGVAGAVVGAVHRIDPEREVNVVSAQGLADCRKMLTIARTGKYDGFLLEGMACPGGCVAGAGTLQPINKATATVNAYTNQAEEKNAMDSRYEITLPLLLED
jgi:[FeFe] hydrogenase (group B1/B3)